jgi:hypothetical protein
MVFFFGRIFRITDLPPGPFFWKIFKMEMKLQIWVFEKSPRIDDFHERNDGS